MTELDARTLDIADIFTGAVMPTEEAPVLLNASVARELSAAKRDLDVAEALLDAASEGDEDERKAERDKAVDRLTQAQALADQHRYMFTVASVPKHVRDANLDAVLEKFPAEFDLFNRMKPDPDADKELTRKTWATHIRRITAPSGASLTPSEADIAVLLDQAPDMAQRRIQQLIDDLYADIDGGVSEGAQAHDFLSMP